MPMTAAPGVRKPLPRPPSLPRDFSRAGHLG